MPGTIYVRLLYNNIHIWHPLLQYIYMVFVYIITLYMFSIIVTIDMLVYRLYIVTMYVFGYTVSVSLYDDSPANYAQSPSNSSTLSIIRNGGHFNKKIQNTL